MEYVSGRETHGFAVPHFQHPYFNIVDYFVSHIYLFFILFIFFSVFDCFCVVAFHYVIFIHILFQLEVASIGKVSRIL